MELGAVSKSIYIFKCVLISLYGCFYYEIDKKEFYDD
jgi:hypothetical protein